MQYTTISQIQYLSANMDIQVNITWSAGTVQALSKFTHF